MERGDTDARGLLVTVINAHPHAVWLADVDDTLTDTVTMHEAASMSITEVLDVFVGQTKALEIAKRFIVIFQLLLISHQSTLDPTANAQEIRTEQTELLARVDEYQRDVKEQWGTAKKFSREILLRLAGEDCGVLLTDEQIQWCIDHYWRHAESHAICFADAVRLTETLSKARLPLFLFTSSDARMTLKENGYFAYDPESSRRSKAHRMEGLRAKGLRYREAFIGDPIDKPTPEFFDLIYQGMERDLHRQLSPANIIVLGDSYGSDLEFPVSVWKVALGIMYRRGQEAVTMQHAKVISVGTWDIVSEVLGGQSGRSHLRRGCVKLNIGSTNAGGDQL